MKINIFDIKFILIKGNLYYFKKKKKIIKII